MLKNYRCAGRIRNVTYFMEKRLWTIPPGTATIPKHDHFLTFD